MDNIGIIFMASAIAGFVQAVTGFGGAIILMTILPVFISMNVAPALTGLICFPLGFSIALRYRKDINRRIILIPAIVYTSTGIIAVKIASIIDMDRMKPVFGLMLVALAVYFAFFSNRISLKGNLKTAIICSGISGITSGWFSIGGPLMVLYYLTVTKEKNEYLGTLNFFLGMTATVIMVSRVYNGIITVDMIPTGLIGMGAILLGRFFGSRVVDRINMEALKRIIYAFLAIAGITKVF